MKVLTRLFLIILAFSLAGKEIAFAGPWVQKRKGFRIEWFNQWWKDEQVFDSTGKRQEKPNDGKYVEYRHELKVEYTPWERTSLMFSLPYKTVIYEDINTKLYNQGFSDFQLGIKHLWPSLKDWDISNTLFTDIPYFYDRDDKLALGKGATNVSMTTSIGRIWGENKNKEQIVAYSSFESGYRYQSQEFSDDFIYILDTGFVLEFLNDTQLRATLDGVESIDGTGSSEEDYIKYSLGFLIKLTSSDSDNRFNDSTRKGAGSSLELGYGEVFGGRSTGAGTMLFVKFAYQQ